MMPLYPFLLSAPSVECHHLRMTNVMFFQKDRFFFAGKEPVYYNIDTLISEICAAKGVLPEQDAIILAGYLHDFRKML